MNWMTNYLSLIGLGFDLVGVVLLGIDLVRVQANLRATTARQATLFRDIAHRNEQNRSYAQELAAGADWRHHDYEEGRSVAYGGFDYDRAKSSFTDASRFVGEVGTDLYELADELASSFEKAADDSRTSLIVSYVGLCFVVVGFALQIAALF